MNDFFTFKGQRSTSYGLHVTTQPEIIIPQERTKFITIPGRSGSITYTEEDNIYDDFTLGIECTMADMTRLRDITGWLRGSGALIVPELPGGHYDARVSGSISFMKVMRGRPARTLSVSFRCHPFWYKDSVLNITIPSSGSIVTNPCNVFSQPLFSITGSGAVTLMVNTATILIDGLSGSISIDCDSKMAYTGTTLRNSQVTVVDSLWPVLNPGTNTVSYSGSVSSMILQPRWRNL